MTRPLFLVLLSLLLIGPVAAQERAAAYRAQGRYYSALEAFKAQRYSDAAEMLRQSRDMLGGKSNIRLQYLLVRSLYHAGRFKEAQTEMNFYLRLEDRKAGDDIYANFPQDVDALTHDETREITMLIDKIDAEVSLNTEGKRALEGRKRQVVQSLLGLVRASYVVDPGHDTIGDKVNRVAVGGGFSSVQVEAVVTMDVLEQYGQRPGWRKAFRWETKVSVDLNKLDNYTMKSVGDAAAAGWGSSWHGANGLWATDRSGHVLQLVFREKFRRTTKGMVFMTSGEVDRDQSSEETDTTNYIRLLVTDREKAEQAAAEILKINRGS